MNEDAAKTLPGELAFLSDFGFIIHLRLQVNRLRRNFNWRDSGTIKDVTTVVDLRPLTHEQRHYLP